MDQYHLFFSTKGPCPTIPPLRAPGTNSGLFHWPSGNISLTFTPSPLPSTANHQPPTLPEEYCNPPLHSLFTEPGWEAVRRHLRNLHLLRVSDVITPSGKSVLSFQSLVTVKPQRLGYTQNPDWYVDVGKKVNAHLKAQGPLPALPPLDTVNATYEHSSISFPSIVRMDDHRAKK